MQQSLDQDLKTIKDSQNPKMQQPFDQDLKIKALKAAKSSNAQALGNLDRKEFKEEEFLKREELVRERRELSVQLNDRVLELIKPEDRYKWERKEEILLSS